MRGDRGNGGWVGEQGEGGSGRVSSRSPVGVAKRPREGASDVVTDTVLGEAEPLNGGRVPTSERVRGGNKASPLPPRKYKPSYLRSLSGLLPAEEHAF